MVHERQGGTVDYPGHPGSAREPSGLYLIMLGDSEAGIRPQVYVP